MKLPAVEGIEGSDFFSGNYLYGGIDGVEKNMYIATQGPLESTIIDFWRVVWEHKITVVAMLAREYEGSREKVFRYWPDQRNFPLQLGDFYVTLEEESQESPQGHSDELVIRKFSVESLSVRFWPF